MYNSNKDISHSDSQCYTDNINDDTKLEVRDRYSCSWCDSECRNDQLVCSLHGWRITGYRNNVYDTEYKFDNYLLGRCDG